MTAAGAAITDGGVRDPAAVDSFLQAFFGTGNAIAYDPDPTSGMGAWLAQSLRALRLPSDVPVVLPRRRPGYEETRIAYVIARDQRHATEVGEMLTAFVGPTYSYFTGGPADLDPGDPVERAVLELVGEGLTFVLSAPDKKRDTQLWKAMAAMQRTVELRPARLTTVPKPVGRLLGEFEAALAAGESSASADVLEQLATNGGLSGTNLAHLRIKRLARLGRDAELLRLPDLGDVVVADPPAPVADDVLTALFTTALAQPLAAGDLAAARANLLDTGTLVPALLDTAAGRLSPQASTVLALAAQVRGDRAVLRRLLTIEPIRAGIAELAGPVLVEAERALLDEAPRRTKPDEIDVSPAVDIPSTAPTDWVELVDGLAADTDTARAALAEQTWRDWPRPADQDADLAAALADLDDDGAARVWRTVGAFLEADGYRRPAVATAREFVFNAITYGRYAPGDLAAIVALTDIALRGAPEPAEYAELLDQLGADSARWMAPDRATVLLDLAELLARHACPNQAARTRLVAVLLAPLHRHSTLLDADQLAFAEELATELDTGIEWPPAKTGEDGDELRSADGTVLLYSLDEGVLDRTRAAIGRLAPQVRIVTSAEHDGSPRLRQQSRGADVVVLATRCATHAATGFIRQHAAPDALVTEADGSGSASLLRAAVVGLRRRIAGRTRQDSGPRR